MKEIIHTPIDIDDNHVLPFLNEIAIQSYNGATLNIYVDDKYTHIKIPCLDGKQIVRVEDGNLTYGNTSYKIPLESTTMKFIIS